MINFNLVKDILINNLPIIKVQIGDIVVWDKISVKNWILDVDGYIIGEDGKYYQRLYTKKDSLDTDSPIIIDLNEQWVEDTISGVLNIDTNFDYYMSNSNYHTANGYSLFKVTWSNLTEIDFLYRSKAESSYDYLVIGGLDQPMFTSKPSSVTSGILAHTRGAQTDIYNTLHIDCDSGEHHIWFCYIKDSSVDYEPDRAFVGVPKIDPVEIIEKQGLELHYEYIKSNEFIVVTQGLIQYKYYKTYYTPSHKALKTEEFILGDIINATPITRNYLRFNGASSSTSIKVSNLSLFTNLLYSFGFEELFTPLTEDGIILNPELTVYFKGEGTSTLMIDRSFIINNPVECHGNTMSLLGDNFEENKTVTASAFLGLFTGTAITTAPELPAIKLASHCYYNMFYNCSVLTSAPELPATTLKASCYAHMFSMCTALVTVPTLPATKLAAYCYRYMFYRCSNILDPPALPATTLADGCYHSMFASCTSLRKTPKLPATTLAKNCYDSMFMSCYNITTIELPATTLAEYCYNSMLSFCLNLSKIYCNIRYLQDGVTEITNYISNSNWIPNNTGTFYKNPNWNGPIERTVTTIPEKWEIVDWVLTE